MKTSILVILAIVVIWIFLWWLGGIHLDQVREMGMEKAKEICGENSKIIYQGYERSVFQGFGGRTWYQCKKDNIWYQFAITRRIEKAEAQVYNFEQMTTFPTEINLK